jgi:histidyl-tRNA synthetase
MNKLSNEPYKGTSDWYPEEYAIRKYIFDTWRKVCTNYGYQEYLTPLVEKADIYRAKSGEDLGGKELMIMTDRAGREIAIRPEMTPSVTRMISRVYEGETKPIRYFSIANFMRGEKPQRGRNREFWQLNYDIFGVESVSADIEILQIALDIVLSLNPPKESFTLFVNNRKLIDEVLNNYASIPENQKTEVVRILDKWEKTDQTYLISRLTEIGIEEDQIKYLQAFMISEDSETLEKNIPGIKDCDGYKEIETIISTLQSLGYGEWIKFQPNIIRGFDYYDGMVFEVFDNHPENNRAMYGGGRYNGLAELFGSNSFPATGCAPGDETMRLFIESWKLKESILKEIEVENIYIPLLTANASTTINILANKLRKEGRIVEIGLEIKTMGKAFKYADKKKFTQIIIIGDEELVENKYKIKDLRSGSEESINL